MQATRTSRVVGDDCVHESRHSESKGAGSSTRQVLCATEKFGEIWYGRRAVSDKLAGGCDGRKVLEEVGKKYSFVVLAVAVSFRSLRVTRY